MELINATRMVAGYTMGMDPDGREYLVVVVKGTFDIPTDGGEAKLSAEQQPLIAADTFTGEPGFSAPVYESEYCLTKPKCDVLVLGSAYAPVGKPATKVTCGFKLGNLSKVIEVYGDRTWSGPGNTPSRPEPFVTMPITYDRAFGGCDNSNPDKSKAYMENPVGMGFWPNLANHDLEQKPVPNLQEPGKSFVSPRGTYKPMSLGPLGRSWAPRLQYAGTYNADWMENHFPFLPRDFDAQYNQAAPPDQQIAYLVGGEEVVLINLTPDGRRVFTLPTLDCPVEYTDVKFRRRMHRPTIDTLILEPATGLLSIIMRTAFRLQRSILDAKQIVVGNMPKGWYLARNKGKTYVGPVLAQNSVLRANHRPE
jgi:hypothetical protein